MNNPSDLSLNSLDFANNTKDKEQIVRATVGQGTIITNSDTTNLNRDITNTKVITKDESSNIELYVSDTSLDALSDPTQAYDNMKQKAKDVGLAVHAEMKDIPSATQVGDKKGDLLDSTLGVALDKVSFLGLLPSQLNDGGYVTQIATQLFGDNRNILQTTDESKFKALGLSKENGDYIEAKVDGQTTYITNPDKTVRITQNGEKEGNLDNMKIYISEADAKEMGIDHLFTNGIMNTLPEALANQKEQQGSPTVSMLNYNQTHGLAGDSLEMTQEKIAITTNLTQLASGGARQTGDIKTQLTQLNNGNLNTGAHSQGTMQDYLGTMLNKEDISKVVQENQNAKYTTQYSGSPVNSDAVKEVVTDIYGGEKALEKRTEGNGISDVFRSQVNPGDPVALLGGNTAGINNHDDILVNTTEALTHGTWTLFSGKSGEGIFGFLNDPNSPSPHSGYGCVIGCGDSGVTPEFKNYFDPTSTNNESTLDSFYRAINTDPSISNVYIPIEGEK